MKRLHYADIALGIEVEILFVRHEQKDCIRRGGLTRLRGTKQSRERPKIISNHSYPNFIAFSTTP